MRPDQSEVPLLDRFKTGNLTDEDFRRGTKAVLDYLEGFWMGLERMKVGS